MEGSRQVSNAFDRLPTRTLEAKLRDVVLIHTRSERELATREAQSPEDTIMQNIQYAVRRTRQSFSLLMSHNPYTFPVGIASTVMRTNSVAKTYFENKGSYRGR